MTIRTISKLAKELDIGIETIRFYERKGLIEQPKKPVNGYRDYSDSIVNRVKFIRRAQRIGFSLAEIMTLLRIDEQPCSSVKTIALVKLKVIEDKIEELNNFGSSLQLIVEQCNENPKEQLCPFLETLIE